MTKILENHVFEQNSLKFSMSGLELKVNNDDVRCVSQSVSECDGCRVL